MFRAIESVGERFVLESNNGTIAFAASQGVGFIDALARLGSFVYGNMGDDYYGDGIGNIIKASLNDLNQQQTIRNTVLVQQFNLNGDPALKIHPSSSPDFILDPVSAENEPVRPSAQDDAFELSFDLLNIGRNRGDSIVLLIEQELPNGERVIAIRDTVFHQQFRSTYSYNLPITGDDMTGRNVYYVTADASNWVEELSPGAEDNNELLQESSLGYQVFIVDNTARPIWPEDCSVVGKAPVILKASTTDALAPEKSYILQIDTTSDFNSPLMVDTAIVQAGGVIRWVPNVAWMDSTTYYWRVSPDSIKVEDAFIWSEHSFTLRVNSEYGWLRNHYQQYTEDTLRSLVLDKPSIGFKFGASILGVTIDNRYGNNEDPPQYQNGGQFINSPWTWSVNEGINVVVLQFPSLEYWRNPLGGLYGSVNTADGWDSVLPFAYPTEEQEGRVNLINFLENVIPDSAYVLIYSAQRTANSSYYPELWEADSLDLSGKNIFNVLEAQGAELIRETKDNGAVPYVFFYQNGVEALGESLAGSPGGTATLGHVFEGAATEGEVVTRAAGPAKEWKTLVAVFEEEAYATDTMSLVLEGRTVEGNWESLVEYGKVNSDIYHDLSDLSPTSYPQLRVRLYFQDQDQRKPAFPETIKIQYEPLPELAIDPNLAWQVSNNVYQGAPIEIIVGLENVSSASMEETAAQVQVSSKEGFFRSWAFELDSLPPFTSRRDTVVFQAADLIGNLELSYELNPERSPRELTYINNQLGQSFFVEEDTKAPVVDVTFDGQRILDRDIIRPNATIRVGVWDDNPYLPLVDTSNLEIRIISPDGNNQQIRYDDPSLLFVPASTDGENKAEAVYEAAFQNSGVYTLQVRGRDQSGVREGLDYEVDFTVVTENTISRVINYPNPFTTQTQFVYTLTGEPPTTFRIQIATVSGRIVREITEAELGPLEVGTHRTDFAWDGRDEFGDRLANGVYLYRITAKDADGNDYKALSDFSDQAQNLDRYFNNGWGKMVLMR